MLYHCNFPSLELRGLNLVQHDTSPVHKVTSFRKMCCPAQSTDFNPTWNTNCTPDLLSAHVLKSPQPRSNIQWNANQEKTGAAYNSNGVTKSGMRWSISTCGHVSFLLAKKKGKNPKPSVLVSSQDHDGIKVSLSLH